jgi:ABC-type multidrug transport system fused ATPase/permease subunit
VLRGVSLRIDPGEHIAVVGTTGAGKTTLARIAAGLSRTGIRPRLARRQAGRPRRGTVELTSVDESELRGHIAMVAQEVPHLLRKPCARNVALPKPSADDAAVLAALDTVGAGWAHSLPKGLDTWIGEGGTRLSAVQEQTIALARLVLADPDFAILDEATAEAGSAGAHVLEASAESALTGRGALIVAHRLSQAEKADRILVMEHGQVIEEGTHDELVAAGGRYAALWEAWSA